MKKTLVALAVLAASGASFAQVTITGNYIYGYKASTTSAQANKEQATTQALAGGNNGNPTGDSSGLGIDTSTVTFEAKEDLGSGMSVTASMNIDTMNRGGIAGGDSSLKLLTSLGQLKLETYKIDDYISGSFGAGGVGMDNKVFPARTFKDAIGFITKLGPVIVGLKHAEQGTASSVFPLAALGLGVGATGPAAAVGQRSNSISGTYMAGGLVANLNLVVYDNRTDGQNTSNKDVVRAGATYDFGGPKVGGGVEVITLMSGATLSNAGISGSVLLGNVTLGANYATESLSGSAAQPTLLGVIPAGGLDQTRTGYGLSATYAFSKRTSLIANYANWTPYGGANKNTESNLLLSHAF